MRSSISIACRTFLAALVLHGTVIQADPYSAEEAELKAAYLLNIAKFVTWSAGDEGSVVFCLSHSSKIWSFLSAAEGIAISRRTVRVISLPAIPESCHFIYWDQDLALFPYDLLELSKRSVTVSDVPSSLHHGFAIELFKRDLKLRIAINQTSLDHASYKISSKLLRISSVEMVGQ
jgi:hypothetical protein